MNRNRTSQAAIANRILRVSTLWILSLFGLLFVGSLSAQRDLTVQFTVQNPLCSGYTNGQVLTTVTGGQPPYRYSWSTGSTESGLYGVGAGTYHLTVTDSNSDRLTTSVTVSEPAPIQITIQPASNSNFCQGAEGMYVASATGGSGTYTYLWSNGQTTNTLMPRGTDGYYSVTVTDDQGCSKVGGIVIPKRFSVSVEIGGVACADFCDATALAATTGGTAPFRYRWNTGDTTKLLQFLPAGVYTVTVTDANGCIGVATGVVENPPVIEIEVQVTGSCEGQNITATATATGGTGTLTYQWNTGETGQTIINLQPGQTYTVIVTDENGCNKRQQIRIPPNTGLIVNTRVDNASCDSSIGGSVTAITTGGVEPYSYLWSTNDTTVTVSNLPEGEYTVTVTDANGCTGTATAQVNAGDELVLIPDAVNATCAGVNDGMANVIPEGGQRPYTYLWSDGQVTGTAINLAPGTYTVTATDAVGCTGTVTVTIGTDVTINVSISTENSACNDSTGRATAVVSGGVAPYTYLWNTGDTTATLENLSPGTYTVTITDANGCSGSSTGTVISTEGPTITRIDKVNVTCAGASTGSATVMVEGGTAPYSYNWSNGETTPTISNLPTGAYRVTVTDANGCVAIEQVVIEDGDPIELTPSATAVGCLDSLGSATVTISGGTAPYQFEWSDGQRDSVAINLPVGNYTVTVTDANGCTATASAQVVEASLLIDITTTAISCDTTNNGSATVSVSGGTAPYEFQWNNGVADSTITELSAGVYEVTVTDAEGCQATASATVKQDTLILNITTTAVSCDSTANGTATVTVDGGRPPYTYLWSDGQTTATATGLMLGTYFVTVTSFGNCSAVAEVEIANDNLFLGFTVTNIGCDPTDTGKITANVSGGTAPYSFAWSTGETSMMISGLTAGDYAVTITDTNGCSTSGDTSIIQIDGNLQLTFDVQNASCDSTNTGRITANVSGGTAPYSFEWNTGDTTATLENLSAGTYTLTITDANGCTITGDSTITQAGSLNLSLDVQNVSCDSTDNGKVTANVSSGSAPYSFVWSTGDTTMMISGLSVGTYSVTVTDATGCTAVDSAEVEQDAGLNLSLDVQNVSCDSTDNGKVTANVSSGSAPYSFVWSTGDTTMMISGLSVGTYSVTVTDATGCTAVDSAEVEQDAGLNLALDVQNVSCDSTDNGKIIANVSSGSAPYSFVWSTGDTTMMISGLSIGTYSVTVMDATGCTAVDSAEVEQDAGLNLSLDVQNVSCDSTANGEITVSVTGGEAPFTFSWTTGDTTATISGLIVGDYSVTVTDANGCMTSGTATIEKDSIQLQFTTQDASCDSLRSGTATVVATGGAEPYSYLWSTGDTIATVSGLAAGTYSVVVTDANGCTTEDSTTIQLMPFNIEIPSPIMACVGDTVSLNPGGNATYVYQWEPTTGLDDPTSPNPIVVVSSNQTYSVTITDSTATCQVERTVQITSNTISLEVTPDTTICEAGQRITLVATSPQAVRYRWYLTPAFSRVVSESPFLRVGEGTYYVQVESAAGCTALDSITVRIRPIEVMLPEPDPVCPGDSVELTIVNLHEDDMLSFSWTPDDPAILDDPTSDSPIVFPTESTTFEVTIQNQFGCTFTGGVVVEVAELDNIRASANPSTIRKPETSQLSVTFNPTYTYEWSPPDMLDNPFASNPIASPKGTTMYTVTVTNELGCSNTDSVLVTVDTIPCARPFVFLPNAFSPNGDNMNDILYVRGPHIEAILRFEIYNRNGELVFNFETDTDSGNFRPEDPAFGWNGRFRNTGQLVTGDVFGYVLQVKCVCLDQPFSEQGNITVIR